VSPVSFTLSHSPRTSGETQPGSVAGRPSTRRCAGLGERQSGLDGAAVKPDLAGEPGGRFSLPVSVLATFVQEPAAPSRAAAPHARSPWAASATPPPASMLWPRYGQPAISAYRRCNLQESRRKTVRPSVNARVRGNSRRSGASRISGRAKNLSSRQRPRRPCRIGHFGEQRVALLDPPPSTEPRGLTSIRVRRNPAPEPGSSCGVS